jgi:hypothetical protein
MANIRYLAPGSGRGPSTRINGNTHGGSVAGAFVDLPDNSNDNAVLSANGYAKIGYVGTTAQRPTNPSASTPYIDTTLSKTVYYDGIAWRDPVSGSVV